MAKTVTKTHTNTSRIGIAIERIVEMDKSNVDHDVIALQMKKNSGETFTSNDIASYIKLYKATKSKVTITKEQKNSLIRDEEKYGEKRRNLKIA